MGKARGPLGVGVIGLGVGMAHASSFSSPGKAEVRWVCDVDEDRCAAAKSLVPSARVSSDWRDLVEAHDIDVVVVSTPDHLHADIIEFSLDHQKHVFAEKPVCLSESELSRVAAAHLRSSNRLFSANMVLRANPVLIELRRELVDGRMGVISHLEANYLYGRFNKITNGWRGRPPRYSAMLGGGIHMLDLSLWLVGKRPLSVFGIGNSIASVSRGQQIDDFELAVLRFANGVSCTVAAVMASSVPHSHVLTVHGTKKTFMLGPFGYQYLTSSDTPVDPPRPLPRKFDRSSIASAFIDSVLGLREPNVTTQEVLDCTAVALAVRESIATDREVVVRYP